MRSQSDVPGGGHSWIDRLAQTISRRPGGRFVPLLCSHVRSRKHGRRASGEDSALTLADLVIRQRLITWGWLITGDPPENIVHRVDVDITPLDSLTEQLFQVSRREPAVRGPRLLYCLVSATTSARVISRTCDCQDRE